MKIEKNYGSLCLHLGYSPFVFRKGYLVRDDNMKPLYMIGCINESGERQKADNISGLLGERSFTVKAVADEQEWTMIRKLYPEFTQGYFGLH